MKESQDEERLSGRVTEEDEERLSGRVTEAVGKAQHVNDGIYFKLFFS